MNKSESIQELAKALVLFHSKMGKVSKDAKNPFFKSSYASLPNILDAVQPILSEVGLSIVQLPSGANELTTMLIHVSGEYISSTYEMKPTKQDPQGLGSAITYQRRYALGAILSLSIDEDDDGNKASAPAPKQEDTRPWLDEKAFNGMMSYIREGKGEVVLERMDKYRMKKEYKTALKDALLEAK